MLREWIDSGDGKSAWCQLSQCFQEVVGPEELALGLAVMLVLWNINDPPSEADKSPWPPRLTRLDSILFWPSIIEESELFLSQLLWSFMYAIESIDEKQRALIMGFLERVAYLGQVENPDKGLVDYWRNRLHPLSHGDTKGLSDTTINEIIHSFSELNSPPGPTATVDELSSINMGDRGHSKTWKLGAWFDNLQWGEIGWGVRNSLGHSRP